MSRIDATEIVSHWNTMIEGMQQSSDEFYNEVERLIRIHSLKDVKIERVNIAEGGMFSSRREYLQVRRAEYVFHVCAAPYGNGFFVSWWFGTVEKGLIPMLQKIPYVGNLFRLVSKPWTYYRADTANMFNSITKGAVNSALNAVLEAKGMRALSHEDAKPVMRELFAHA